MTAPETIGDYLTIIFVVVVYGTIIYEYLTANN